ncbi:Cyclopentanol dehydrogenase [Enhygromyxa salina]|uniref:Cyclopentanol dehydrogenase n=1 Tax=Enhygromyxa salina TaxID=215803 RepID=A0A2S9YVD3_9BACT|nr:Cyclopentanol dehydrogenase [Enhygromyxa salina]
MSRPSPLVVFITGTSSGIGEALALHRARLGDTVFATMRNLDAGSTLEKIAAEENLDLRLLALDLTDDESVTRAVSDALDQTGHIDVLINNAGISTIQTVEGSLAAARETFEVNYFGMLKTITAVLPSMRERRSGTIINVSSVTGVVANAGSGAYAASKHAIEAMSESLALEVISLGIRVIILEPGFIATPIFPKAQGGEPPSGPYAKHIRRGRLIYSDPAKRAMPAVTVAEVVAGALTDPEPKLRYYAGSAKPLMHGRRRTSDEEWLSLGQVADDDDEAWFALIAKTVNLALVEE